MQVLKPENYIERINTYSEQDWKPLLGLMQEIEKVETFGDDTEAMKLLEKGIIDMNPYVENKIVEEFRQACYAVPIIIDFDWGAWEEGRKMVSEQDFDYDTIDIPTKCKIITAIIRNDRFCSGRLVEAFETGMMLKVLKSIRNQVVDSKKLN
jgi:hypothetical protein